MINLMLQNRQPIIYGDGEQKEVSLMLMIVSIVLISLPLIQILKVN